MINRSGSPLAQLAMTLARSAQRCLAPLALAASITASAHVVGSLFNASYEATAYGVALFLLAEGVAYYIEVYALFEGRLRWWLWLLRWVGPLLSAAAGGLAAYGWLPDAYKGLAQSLPPW
jgi:hypothetical protein